MSREMTLYHIEAVSYEVAFKKAHCHKTLYQMSYMMKGNGIVVLEGKQVVLAEKQAILIFPEEEHCYWYGADSEAEILEIKFGVFSAELAEALRQYFSSAYTASEEVERMVAVLLDAEKQTGNYAFRAVSAQMEALIYRILAEQCRKSAGEEEQSTWGIPSLVKENDTAFMRRVVPFLKGLVVYETALDVSLMAKRIGYSKRYLCSKFIEETGMSIKEYFRLMRMGYAKDLLRETDLRISEIGSLLRYERVAFFSREFKRCWGITPSEYRKRSKETT